MSRFSLQGRTALVTGGARGCGLAFARGLAQAGADVAIFDVIAPEEGFHSIEKEYGVRTAYYKVDVSSPESLAAGFSSFQTDFSNALDICVPCAGINRHQTFLDFKFEDHHDLLKINVLGLFHTAQLAARQMIANQTQHGSIVLVASMASHIAVKSQLCSAYCGSKGAVRAMCPAIAKEMAEYPNNMEIPSSHIPISTSIHTQSKSYTMAPSATNEGLGFPTTIPTTTVVVVGAGPSGLMLASNLLRYGTPVILLDDRPSRTTTGKADGLQPKTIETLKQLRLADELLRNGAKVYDISFWDSTPTHPLRRSGRQLHYPDHLVGASDPYILLAHQGMLEDVLIGDIEARGGRVQRSSAFVGVKKIPSGEGKGDKLEVVYEDVSTRTEKIIHAGYLVGCDGARSKVRDFIPDAKLEGEMTNASWGVLDGVIDTDFPDLWSKVAVRSHTAGSILWIPRERGMTRLYVELSSTDGEKVDRAKATTEYVIARAREAMSPFRLEWKSIEWFGNYVVGQRVARNFSDPDNQIFIAGDAGHCHSALAAQGANTSMHDSFNLAWKLNLVSRGLAHPSLLSSYGDERRKIANDLISFDAEHVAAFEKGEAALARNFDENIRFISGVGAEYTPGLLTRGKVTGGGGVKPGSLMPPANVTRYIDANPVDVQLDVPMLGQFRVYLFTPDVSTGGEFLDGFCEGISTSLEKIGKKAETSYIDRPRGYAERDEYVQPGRYTIVSQLVTYGLVTKSTKKEFELGDLPEVLQRSRWTVYLDDVDEKGCTMKWMGEMEGGRWAWWLFDRMGMWGRLPGGGSRG
ncbi:hypothetical protein BO94DRAFT_577875 [Aspergillus sclerotioniger CBS 115572]|uniref:FAD binding domain protein n=1 Tax=Aspergillus sclerotioniger CBS 115572 TaxID=1450535 RepID=A0A317VNZ0_9EURO|nr:hypothetical protein BO94DRAFT_577875 [Aspergillus sclerotioniger CBS 115572]PWY76084.1 hypothetical protein BO94DRAFT_577875 [Aspergillus sclerotioniger CBS 115572]